MTDANVFSPSSPLGDALVILGAAGVVIPLFARFRVTPVIGFILVGLLVGPYGLGRQVFDHPWLAFVTITDPDSLKPFAEFGIVLLLFNVGLELSFDRLWAMRRQVFGLGALELTGAAALIGFTLALIGESSAGALGLGLALAMSSTALVLPIAGTTTPVGRAALAMLLFEDLALVPTIFLLGALAPHNGGGWQALLHTLGLGVALVTVLLVGGRYLLPPLFAQAARTKSPELFLATSLIVVITAALATAGVGLSPIVGALIAGLLIGETPYHGEVEGMTAPFKGLALGVFLITIGMSIDLAMVARHWVMIVAATAGVVVVKALVTGIMLRVMGTRAGTAAEAGILMSSPSESTLIVLTAASGAALIQPSTVQFWQIVTALGLTITPGLAWLGRRLARKVDAGNAAPLPDTPDSDEPRAIIIGFGRVGRLVADMLRHHGKGYIAVDSNPDLITGALSAGYHATFGDAASGHTLERLGLDQAHAVILTMDEPVIAQRLVRKLRAAHPDLAIIARARDATHAAALYKAGASMAVPETLESSLQLSEAVLVDLGVPMGFVIASIHEKRDEFREQIMAEGGLTEKPSLKSATLRERSAAE
ncbi:cation:proton antiporter domain-containing protein [Novosphingobium terrae]|uniref:cation:proton antiporter domain-containing protein n=1 Tax=Novosphingobium terrae TaxID=2726189 RepID=UPI00197ED3E2|nr:cation:proton antiporter [Novosphingobium terrae]